MLKNDVNKRKEHEAIRNAVGWYNFTHKLVEVVGNDASVFLDKIYPNAIGKAKVGDAKYTTMLNEDGIIIDDVIVFRVEESKYWISTLYVDELLAWFDKHKGNSDISYKNITDAIDMYAVQGPKSREILNRILKDNVDDMKFFSIKDNMIDDLHVRVARMGYTGELGYEVMIDSKKRDFIEKKLIEAGKDLGAVQITELDVIIGSIPSEKGYILMSDIEGTNPYEVNLAFGINWNKEFIGKEALEKAKENIERDLVGFVVEDDNAVVEPNDIIMNNGEEVGKVTRFTYGFSLDKGIGYALISKAKVAIGDNVEINGVKAVLTDRGWYDMENLRPLGK